MPPSSNVALVHATPTITNAPSASNGVKIQVSETIDGGRARVVYKGQEEKSLDALPSIRLVLLPSSNQRFTFTVSPIGSVTITLRELLSESAASAGFKLKPLPKDGEDVSALADELYSSSSPASGGPTIRFNIVAGVGTVLSAPRQGERSILGRDVSRLDSATPKGNRGSSKPAETIQAGHHGDLKFKEHPTYSSNGAAAGSPKAGRTFELSVGVTNVPALDALVGVHPLVAAFGGKNGASILSHSELGLPGQGSVSQFATRLLVGESDAPIHLSVYDTTGDDELGAEHVVGESEAIPLVTLEHLAQSGNAAVLPLTSKKVGVEKKLRKRNTEVILHQVRVIGGNPLSLTSAANAKPTVNRVASLPVSKESFVIRPEALIFVDSKGKEHPSSSISSPKASSPKSTTQGSFNLSTSGGGLPKLDPLRDERNIVVAVWEVNGANEVLIGHTEISSDANPSFKTPFSLATSEGKLYRVDVHDLSEERATLTESLIGSFQVTGKDLAALKDEDELPRDWTSTNAALQKKLAKKSAKAYLARSGASDEVLAKRAIARANGGVYIAPVTPKAAPVEAEVPKAAAAPTPTAAYASAPAPAPVQTDSSASSSSTNGTAGPSSPQHQAEQEAITGEANAVAGELAAKQRLAAAEQALKEMKPLPQGKKDSKATLARQQAEKELAEAHAANELATKHAAEARANLAAKREARIKEEDRLRALAEAERAANPNMTLWGERKRGGSVMTDSLSGTGIEQVAIARRTQAASGTQTRGGEMLLVKLSISGAKAIGAWKPLIGVYGDSSSSNESVFLDHTDRLDSVQEDGTATFSRPVLFEVGDSKIVRFHLFNQSADRATVSDLIATSSIDISTLSGLPKGQELVLHLRAGNKALADRLKRQDASVVVIVAGRSSSTASGAGGIIPSNPPIPSTMQQNAGLSVDTDVSATGHKVRPSASYVVSPVAEESAAVAAAEKEEQVAGGGKDVPASASAQPERKGSDIPAESPAGSPAASDDEDGGANKADKKKKKKKKNKSSVSEAPAAGPVKFNLASPAAAAPTAASSSVPAPSTVEEVVAIVQEEPSAPADDSAASNVPAGEVGAGMKICSSCNKSKSKKEGFSAAQGKKPNGKCKDCVV